MASLKLAAAALALVVLLCAAATTATASRAYRPEPKPEPQPQPQPQPQREDCKTQAEYFKNCLRLGHKEKCCEIRRDAAGRNCYCEVERETQIECAHERKCPGLAGIVKVAEMHLSCMKEEKLDLVCKRA